MKKRKIYNNRLQHILHTSVVTMLLLLTPSIVVYGNDTADKTITGVVCDAATDTPLSGARIQAHNTPKISTMTDENGTFSLNVPDYVTLLDVTAPDYNLVQYPIQKNTTINIKLYSTTFKADYNPEIYTSDRNEASKFDLNTSFSIDDDIQTRLGADVRTIMRGGTPGMGGAMFIGGLNSLNANSQPLFVIDGVFIDQQYTRDALHDGFYNNILSYYSVNDIEKVTVLKNATALYGTKGSNGVILIDTKRSKSMATRIDVNISAGVTFLPKLPSMMDGNEYRLYASELIGGTDTKQTSFNFLNDSQTNNYYYYKYHNNTDWSDYTYREALTQNYSIGVQGGDDIAQYNLTLGYVNAESTLENNDFTRLNIRFNTDVNLSSRLDVRFDVSFTKSTRDIRDDGVTADYTSGSITAPGFLSLIKSPFLSPYLVDQEGNLTPFLEDADDYAEDFGTNTSLGNPVGINSEGEGKNKNWLENSLFNITVTPKYRFSKSLTAQTHFSYNLTNYSERAFSPMSVVPVFHIDGVGDAVNKAQSFYSKQISIFNDTRVNWEKQWDYHALNVAGGFRYTDDSYNSKKQTGYNTGNNKTPNISGNLDFKDVEGSDDTWRSFAYYLNANYNYKNLYFLEGNVSMETTSRFGKEVTDGIKLGGVRWGIFPSLQAGWLISSEKWFNSQKTGIDYLKLTAGYDESGNDDINIYAARTSFSPKTFLNNSIGLVFDNIGNTQIQWETTKRFNVGLDLSLLNNRVALGGNFFYSKTDNLLTLKSLPEISGLGTYWSNDGALKNIGFDVNMNIKVINTKDWKWELGGSVAHYKNEITELPDGDYYNNGELFGYITSIYGADILTAESKAAGVFYGYKTAGVYSTTQEANADGYYIVSSTGSKSYFSGGDVRFVDVNGDKEINEDDKTIIGDPNPEFYGNLYTSINWKKFTLSVLFNYCYGNDVYNYQRSQLEAGSRFFNQTEALIGRWIGEGQVTDIPKATFGDPMGNSRFSDRWIEDGSYLRLKTVTLSYTVPLNLTWLHGLSVWCTANNLFTFTKYLGSDPEFSAGNSVLYQGIDRGLLPQSRSVILGVKLNL